MRADADGQLDEHETLELRLFAIEGSLEEGRGARRAGAGAAREATQGGAGALDVVVLEDDDGEHETVVPGHLKMGVLTRRIVDAQEGAGDEEKARWKTGKHYSTAELGGRMLVLWKNRLVVPDGATEIKKALLEMAHDEEAHLAGAARTLMHLRMQARVHWTGMDADVNKYVASCFRCELAKVATHGPAQRGTLSPTLAPYVNHTWYVDLKGPLPGGSGYLMGVVEPLTRLIRLRYLPRGTATEVLEELEEVIWSTGTRPVVLRSDGGQPFNSAAYRSFCAREGIEPVVGVPHHSQGQGSVEVRFRSVAASIIATLGRRAPDAWWTGRTLAHLEGAMNSTVCEPLGGSPAWAYTGREPRTRLSAACDWTADGFGRRVLGIDAATPNDLCEVIAAHHEQLNRVHGRASLATSLAQALTKRAWDASRKAGDFKVGDAVLVHRTAPNKLLPHFTGPYGVDSVTRDGNFVTLRNYLGGAAGDSMVHVSRLLHFDASRATSEALAEFELPEGYGLVADVLEHRRLDDGTLEFKLAWVSDPVPSWLPGHAVRRVTKVVEYCTVHGLGSAVGKGPSASAAPESDGSAKGRGRGGVHARGRGRGRRNRGRGKAPEPRGGAGAPAANAKDGADSDGDESAGALLPMERL